MDGTRMFRDRVEAGRRLGEALARRRLAAPAVLGIPRGGVVVSAEVACRLGAEHGVVVARKIGSPGQPELAVGATTASGATFINAQIAASVGVSDEWISDEIARQSAVARRYEERFGGRPVALTGRDVIVVDDGVATGATAIAAIRAVRAAGARSIVFAAPVGSPRTLQWLEREVDQTVCLIEDPTFFAVGQFYADFHPVEDEEVDAVIAALAPRAETHEPIAPA